MVAQRTVGAIFSGLLSLLFSAVLLTSELAPLQLFVVEVPVGGLVTFAVGVTAALPLWLLVPDGIRSKIRGRVPGERTSSLRFRQLYDSVEGLDDSDVRNSREETLLELASEKRLQVVPETERTAALVDSLDDLETLLDKVCAAGGVERSDGAVERRVRNALRAVEDGRLAVDDELASRLRTEIETTGRSDDAGQVVDAVAAYVAGERDDEEFFEIVDYVADRLDEQSRLEDVLTSAAGAIGRSSGGPGRTEQRRRELQQPLRRLEEQSTDAASALETVLENYLSLDEAVGELESERQSAVERADGYERAFEEIESQLDTEWIRGTVGESQRTTDGGRRRDGPSGGDAVRSDIASLLRRAVRDGVVGERVAATAANGLLAGGSYGNGTVEYDLLDALRRDDPSEETAIRSALAEAVETIRQHAVFTDTLDTSVSVEDVANARGRVEDELDELDSTPVRKAVEDHLERRAHSAETAGENNVVTPYVTYRHFEFLGDLVRAVQRNQRPGSVDAESLEQKRDRIDRLYEQSTGVQAGQRISDHVLRLADLLEEEAREAAKAGKTERADALTYATDRVLGAVIELYEQKKLRSCLRRA